MWGGSLVREPLAYRKEFAMISVWQARDAMCGMPSQSADAGAMCVLTSSLVEFKVERTARKERTESPGGVSTRRVLAGTRHSKCRPLPSGLGFTLAPGWSEGSSGRPSGALLGKQSLTCPSCSLAGVGEL